ncbi:MAG: DUF3192 domain-containing protein [Kangiellaceae bacterium]|nr:DUF3192 domain-containing protein [Kangiellaceae bacterium]
MKQLRNLAVVAVSVITLNGCVIVAGEGKWSGSDWQAKQERNREMISELSLQMDRADVAQKMGVPEFSDAFAKDGKAFRVLYYRTQHTRSDGDTTRDETTPLVFADDKLIGWGQDTLDKIRD